MFVSAHGSEFIMFLRRINPGLTTCALMRSMAYENGAFDATLAAAAGDDSALAAELRAAFLESSARQLDLLRRARCDGNWHIAALRLKGIAASFHVAELMDLAEDAVQSAPGDPVIVRKISTYLSGFGAPQR